MLGTAGRWIGCRTAALRVNRQTKGRPTRPPFNSAFTLSPALNGQETVQGRTAPHVKLPCYALTAAGFQMLILRVSGITKTAMMKHTAGTKIG
jgi:hypothetical protein